MQEKFLHKFLNNKTFIVCNLLVFIAKISYSYSNHFIVGYFEDWSIARNLANFGIYAIYTEVGATAYKLPIYPLFLSFFFKIFPNFTAEAVIIFQHFIYFFIPLIIIKITKLFGRQKAGILAGYLFIFSPAYFFYSNVLESTNVFIPIFLFWIFLFLKIYKAEKISFIQISVFGVFTSILFLTQIVVVPIAIVFIVYLWFYKKLKFLHVALFFLFAGLFYTPWIVRNYLVFNKIVVTKTPFWQNIYMSFSPEVNLLNDVKIIPKKNVEITLKKSLKVNEFEMEKIYKAETLKVLQGREYVFVEKALQNAFFIWYVPSRFIHDNSFEIVFGRKIYVTILNIFTLFSLIYFYKRNRKLFYATVLIFVGFTVPYMIGHAANTRFKLDFEWYQLLVVAVFLDEILNHYFEKQKSLHYMTKI